MAKYELKPSSMVCRRKLLYFEPTERKEGKKLSRNLVTGFYGFGRWLDRVIDGELGRKDKQRGDGRGEL